MDKNKAAYKLKGLSPIYYLNLDEQPERRQYMEEQFKYWEIENYTRISNYCGYDLLDHMDNGYAEVQKYYNVYSLNEPLLKSGYGEYLNRICEEK